MLQTIVVPLDGSPLAEHALPYATALARVLAARVVLLHARWTAVFPEEGAPDLHAIASRLRADGVAVDTHVCHMPRVEDAGRTILDAAVDLRAGLIVMATHGRGGLGRWLYGSVADQVLRQATLPVLLVPATGVRPLPADGPLRILVPLDGSELAEAVLSPLQVLVKAVATELLVLRVAETIEFKLHGDECPRCRQLRARGEEPDLEQVRARRYVHDIADRLRAGGLMVEPRMEFGDAASTISRIARERDVDLIAMATRGRGGLERLVLGSVATATLQQAAVPVLLVRPGMVRRAVAGEAEPSLPQDSDAPRPW